MDIQEHTVKQLEQLALKGPKHVEAIIQEAPELGYIVGVPPAEGRGAGASIRIENYDRYSALLRYLEIYDNSLTIDSQQTQAYLEQCAAEIIRRATFLEEPLELLEIEPVEGRGADPYQHVVRSGERGRWDVEQREVLGTAGLREGESAHWRQNIAFVAANARAALALVSVMCKFYVRSR